ncbi:MAG: homocysteine S-methyltransferase family protein [Phycisphaerae bacterium]
MAKKSLENKLREGLLFLDGAMGTQLMARNVVAEKGNDWLNVEQPQVILDIHNAYFKAGCDAVLANTLGANEISLARHGLGDEVEKLNKAGVKIARQAADAASGDKYVLGDISSCGEFLQPLGTLEPARLKEVFAKQAKALCDAGVDGFAIETFMAVDEAKVAAEAVLSVCNLPVFVSLAFDPAGNDFRTMMGASAETIAAEFSSLGIRGLGFNCGNLNMEQYLALAEKFVKLLKGTNIALLAEPNAGKPELIDGKAVYKLSADDFANWLEKIYSAGATILGGCCGTSPAHIAAMTKKIRS